MFVCLSCDDDELERGDSERENAGLNVTCASRVFLVEPVVHYGFEIQGEECTVIIIDGICE